MVHCKPGFASIVLDLTIGSWPADRSAAYSTLLTLDILPAQTGQSRSPCLCEHDCVWRWSLQYTQICKCYTWLCTVMTWKDSWWQVDHNFAVRFALWFWLWEVPSNILVGRPFYSSPSFVNKLLRLGIVHPAPDHQTVTFVSWSLLSAGDDLNHFKPRNHE